MPLQFESEIAKEPHLKKGPWLDVHAHLNFLEESPEESLRKAREAGVHRIITIGTEPQDLPVVYELSQRHYPEVTCTLGIHPHEAKLYTQDIEQWIFSKGSEKNVVALGEMGLDYFYKNSTPDEQKVAFEKQLALAERLQLPVEIHTRDAEEDTVALLKNFAGRVKGIIHCFTGSQWLAEECLKLGYNISFSGIVTFKNAQSLRSVAEWVPVDRMHVETDAPFLTPTPFRGVKNSPYFVVYTSKFMAELKNMSLEDFAKQMIQNARVMFPKLPLDSL